MHPMQKALLLLTLAPISFYVNPETTVNPDFTDKVEKDDSLEKSLTKFNFSVLEVKRSICARFGETVYVHCFPEKLDSDQRSELVAILSHGFWKTELGGIIPEGAVEPRRYAVDDQLVLQIKNAKPEDTGLLTCTLVLRKSNFWKSTVVLVSIYDVPRLGLELPVVLGLNESCYGKSKTVVDGNLNVFQEMLCGKTDGKMRRACQYEALKVVCHARAPAVENGGNIGSYLELKVRKTPHPKFRSPPCSDECTRSYYVNHINANLDQVIRISKSFYNSLPHIKSISTFHPTKMLTMRRYFYICPPGFSFTSQCKDGKVVCLSCEPGTYADATMNRCEKCPVDYYQDHFGGDTCIPCPPGKGTGTKTGTTRSSFCYEAIKTPSHVVLLSISAIVWCAVALLLCFGGVKILLDGFCPADASGKFIEEMERKEIKEIAALDNLKLKIRRTV